MDESGLDRCTVDNGSNIPHRQTTNNAPNNHPTPHAQSLEPRTMDGSSVQSSLECESNKMSLDNKTESCCQMIFSWRFAMALMLCLASAMNWIPNVTMPISLVCMNRAPTSSSLHGNATTWNMTNVGYNDLGTNSTSQTQHQGAREEFSWNSELQGLILSASFFIASASPMLALAVSRKLGNKWTVVLFSVYSAVLTLITPTSARISPYFLVVVRILQGLTILYATSVIGDTLAWWSPHAERLTLATVAYLGVTLTGAFSFIFGYICSIPIDNGWPFVFYVSGAILILFTISWIVLTSPKPETHPFISDREKLYILTHRRGMDSGGKGQKKNVPYKKIFTSIPVLAFMLCCGAFVCSILGISISLPNYFNKVLGIPVEKAGIIMTMNTVAGVIGAVSWPAMSNFLISRCRIPVYKSRKICIVAGKMSASMTFLGLFFLDGSTTWVTVTLTIATYFCLAVGTGVITALPLDMAPRYAGFISSLEFTFCSVLTTSIPLLISFLTPTNSLQEWQSVWILFAALTLTGALVFLFLGDASMQPWATPTIEETNE